jgi:uncharacterized protein
MPLENKELEVLKELKRTLKKVLRDNFIELEIFGSKVRGTAVEDSDIDILILVKKIDPEVLDLIAEEVVTVKLSTDLPISPVVYTLQEFEVNKSLGSPFVYSIEKESIRL